MSAFNCIVASTLVLALGLFAAPGLAQAPPPYGAEITLETAKKIAVAAIAEAVKNKWAVAVAIVDNHGFLVYYERLDDTQTAGPNISVEKARTAAMFRRPSRAFEDQSKTGVAILGLPGATPIAGGLPIVVDGKIVGGVGVSGATSDQDEQVARAGLDGLNSRGARPRGPSRGTDTPHSRARLSGVGDRAKLRRRGQRHRGGGAMAEDRYDRTTQDVGNIVALEHVNVKIPDQQLATLFYVVGLGLTRDPYLMTGLENMWVNIGQQQFHLPTGAPQVVRGDVGLVIADFEELPGRLAMIQGRLGGTKFAYSVEDKHVRVVSPWGNVIRCHAPGPAFGDMTLGMPYVEFAVEPGVADGIARFYREGLGAAAAVVRNGGGVAARVTVGPHQELIFRETAGATPPYDGHHIQIYIASFSGPHRWLAERGLITEESNWYQYRFEDIIDPDTRRVLFTIEHEVRSLRSPLYLRPLVNRNPAQRQPTYQRGRDAFVPGMS